MRMGMVTAHLRQAAELAGPLGDVSHWTFGSIPIGVLYWIGSIAQIEGGWCGGATSWVIWLVLLQGICWTIVLACLPPDRVPFATGSLSLILVPFVLGIVESTMTGHWCSTNYFTTMFIGPLILAMSISGPARIAQLPVFGPVLMRMVLGFKVCTRREGQGAARHGVRVSEDGHDGQIEERRDDNEPAIDI